MGYKLCYGAAKPSKYKKTVRVFFPLTVLFMLVSISVIIKLWPAQMHALKQSLFPWTAEPVQTAVQELQTDLRAGEDLGIALEVFCRQILEHGG